MFRSKIPADLFLKCYFKVAGLRGFGDGLFYLRNEVFQKGKTVGRKLKDCNFSVHQILLVTQVFVRGQKNVKISFHFLDEIPILNAVPAKRLDCMNLVF